ncbi:hypothetical protein [Micromonospora aurantiaca (nom. illeg.)]|uniref:hypothetical protein n=1 Tax=Micromonospora aurantiaca (nom. illeg.) TaxID=47850 RepID=UPI003F4A217A
MGHHRLGYVQDSSSLVRNILIPKYYEPSIDRRLAQLAATHELVQIGDLVAAGHIKTQSGHDIGKITYGTGRIPFVRTSDLSDWELKAQPKQGVSREVFDSYAPGKQDVLPNDVFMVKDGTYLVGTPALVTEADLPLLYQSHLLRMRVEKGSPIHPALLVVALSSPIVRRQIRAKQFSAGILDKIENRYLELVLPVPKGPEQIRIAEEALALIYRRAELRELLRRVPGWVSSHSGSLQDFVPESDSDEMPTDSRLGFTMNYGSLGTTLIPKYYDPSLAQELAGLSGEFDLITIGSLVEKGILSASTGVEVGKMAYGTGSVPFVRTSDLSNWELKGEPKQKISQEIFDSLDDRLDAKPGDVLLVRDGTYLVGTSAIVSELDGDLLFSGGVYKLRCHDTAALDPYLLIALLNLPIVRRQMKSKQFTRDIIDTLGKRLFEVVLPIPREAVRRDAIASTVRAIVSERAALRERAKMLALEIEGPIVDEEEQEFLALEGM